MTAECPTRKTASGGPASSGLVSQHTNRKTTVLPGLVCLLAIVVVYVLAVRTLLGQTVDTAAMTATANLLAETQWTQTLLDLVSPLSVVLGALAIAAVGYFSHGSATAAKTVGAITVTVGSAQLLKAVLTRPDLLDAMANSLPSGHVAGVAGLAVGATLAVPAVLRSTAAVAGGIVVTLTAVATMAQQWHRPSDVFSATLLAAAVALFLGSSSSRSRATG
ncbi:MAG: phosphatase PAP2 family protein [Ornithinimicrobium sp.]